MNKKIAVLTSGWSLDFVLSVLGGMKRVCLAKNIDLYVFTSYKSYESNGEANTTGFAIFDLFNPKDYDGVVLMSNLFNDQERADYEYKRILKSGIPAVSINQQLEGFDFIGSNNHEVYKELVSHLIEVHHISDFAYIGGPNENIGAESNLNAFKEVLKEHNIPVKNERLFLNGDWSFEFAYKKAVELFEAKDNLPQAVVGVNDWAAMAVIKAALERKINVPEDLKVIGFDDVSCAKSVVPSISTVNIQADLMGEQAIKMILNHQNKNKASEKINIKAIPYFRQSCGCEKELSFNQKIFSINSPQKVDYSQRFASHLRHIENVFIKNGSIDTLNAALQGYFSLRHPFEGSDFSILIKEEVIKSLGNSDYPYQESTTYGKKMRTIVSIKDGKAFELDEDKKIILTKDLIPSSMKNSPKEKNGSLYLFVPIYIQKYLQGYYVSKNSLEILNDKIAYNWTRNFGTSIEKFRQTLNYKLMSEQLEKLSTMDALSGLLNRAGLDIFASKLFDKNNEENKKTYTMFIDINSMKMINDKYGHLHGDLAVKTVAETIKHIFPKSFLKIRYGGDEFVIIGTTTEPIKTDYQAKIKEDLETRTKNMSLPYELSVSMGTKIFMPNEKQNIMQAIEEVDEIMYEYKTAYHKKNS